MAALDPEPTQPIWARPATLIAVVLAMLVLKLIVAGTTELVFDEGYYTLWSMHPSASYFDHPPAVAWMIAIGRAIAGNNEFGVRLLAVLSEVAIAAAIYRIGNILFDARVAALAVIWHAVSVAAALTLITTPDAPSILSWTLTLWAVAEFIRSRNANWWLAVGLFAGLGLCAKLTNLFLAPGLLLFLLSSVERRRWLGLWQVWGSVLVALVVFAPVIWWNAGHDWVTFWFQGQRTIISEAGRTDFFGNIGELLLGQALAIGPALLCFIAAGGVLLALRRGGKASTGVSLVLLTALPLLAYFIYHATHARVEANWPLPVWPGLSLCGAWAAITLVRPGLWGGVARVGRFVQVPVNALLIALVFAQALFHPFPPVSFDRTRDLYGWRQLHAEVRALAEQNGGRWVVNAGEYGLVGELSTYALFAGDPLPIQQLDDRSRYRFAPPLDSTTLGWPALYVATINDPAAPVPPSSYFGKADLLEVLVRQRGSEVLGYYAVYLVSDPTPAFAAFDRS